MHPSAARAEAEVDSAEWRQGRDTESAGAKILACPYTDGIQARRWRAGWTASTRTAPTRYASGHGGYIPRFGEPRPQPEGEPSSRLRGRACNPWSARAAGEER